MALTLSERDVPLLKALSTNALTPNIKQLDAHLQKGRKLPGTWSTPILYGAPGTPLGPQISFSGLIFNVPKKYQGCKDIALTYGDTSTKREGDATVVTGRILHVVRNFPTAGGWYGTDKATGIPKGEQQVSSDNPRARRLWRVNGAYVGAVVRGDDWVDGDRRYVYADVRPSDGFKVASFEQAKPELKLVTTPNQNFLMKQLRGMDACVVEAEESLARLERQLRALKLLVRRAKTLNIKR